MKKLLLAAIGAIAMTASASAADLAARPYAKAPAPMIAAVYDWSGFYIGLNGGGATSREASACSPARSATPGTTFSGT